MDSPLPPPPQASRTRAAPASVPVRGAQHWHRILRAGLWYASLSDALRKQLLALGSVRSLTYDQYLFRRGDEANGVYAVLEGGMRVSALTGTASRSTEMIFMDLQPANWFGVVALFDRGPRTYDARATGPTQVMHLRQSDLEQLLESHPQYWRDFGRLLGDKFRVTLKMVEDLVSLPASARLASRILQMCSGFGWIEKQLMVPPGYRLRISQAELALMVGYTRQTVNNLLMELQSRNWLALHRGVIEIIDPVALQREASGLVDAPSTDPFDAGSETQGSSALT